ncbi:MAG: hypothetical protein P8N76_02180 [Pirellulaceae bacterium]|nr:hypothetical protein [Pirellulaceae bacterium]
MTRPIVTLAAFFVLSSSIFVVDASAGCGRGRHIGCRIPSRPVAVRHRRPLRPVVIKTPVLIQQPIRQLPTIPAGSTLTVPGNFLGNQPGSVLMVFNNVKLPVQIIDWKNHEVTIKLPPMAIRKPVVIRLDIVLPNGNLGLTQRANVTPPATILLHSTRPASPLPTMPAIQSSTVAAPEIAPVDSHSITPITSNTRPAFEVAPQLSPQLPATNPQTAGTPAEPIVLPLPNATGPQPGLNSTQGLPGQPIVLPPVTAQPGAETPGVVAPSSHADPLENNPILNEHRSHGATANEAAPQGTSDSFFSMVRNLLND